MHAKSQSAVQHPAPPPPPPHPEETDASCALWKMTAYPVLNDGSDIIVHSNDGTLVPGGVQDLTLVSVSSAHVAYSVHAK